jgi:hypothetical protein
MQTRRAVLGSLALGLLFASPQAFPQDKKAGPTVQVQLSYTGSGTVDEKHKIYVALWDSPDFMQGGGTMPVSIQPADSKTGTVTFADVKTMPAYASAVFDTAGSWDATSGPPPSGASLGLYSKTPGQPEPIKGAAGETVKVTLAFDDTAKMP